MTKLEILTYPNKFLHQPTQPVENIDEVIQKLVADMVETMYEAPGVGLAAIQVGSDKQVLVYDEKPTESDRGYGVIINPKIVETEGQIISENEGCLSVPDFRSDVKRAARIVVEGVDRDGKSLRFEADGFLAIVLQHEIDHLNGTLFIDRISALKRELYKRRMKKIMREK
ncbi:MAG: peptide deformylase [Desulfobacterales bacterium]|jgi:peptide deformylase